MNSILSPIDENTYIVRILNLCVYKRYINQKSIVSSITVIHDSQFISYLTSINSSNIYFVFKDLLNDPIYIYSDNRYKLHIEKVMEDLSREYSVENIEELDIKTPIKLNIEFKLLDEENTLSKYLDDLFKRDKVYTLTINYNNFNINEFNQFRKIESIKSIENFNHSLLNILKSENEITLLTFSNAISLLALTDTLLNLSIGDSEEVIAKKLLCALYQFGATDIAFPPIVALDENSADIHHTPDEGKYITEDSYLLLIDFGGSYFGYCTDITRVFKLKVKDKGKIKFKEYKDKSDPIYKEYKRVQNLQKEIQNAIHTKSLPQISKYIKDTIGMDMKHSWGHGLGINVHEELFIKKNDKCRYLELLNDKFNKKQLSLIDKIHSIFLNSSTYILFTIEPGIYKPDEFGIRIEDDYIIDLNQSSFIKRCYMGDLIFKHLIIANNEVLEKTFKNYIYTPERELIEIEI